MLIILFALAVATTPIPATLQRDLTCVATLAVDAKPDRAAQGGEYAALVGADLMDATGLSRDAVARTLQTEAAAVRSKMPDASAITSCERMMRARISLEAPLPEPRR